MAINAAFEKIQKIMPHGNADSLEIALVSNFPCVVRKGEFEAGDWCFYIRDDAKLVDYDAWKEWTKAGSDPGRKPGFKFPWQEPLMNYLGGGGRVKTIKLRGKTSMGILLKPEAVLQGDASKYRFEDINKAIKDPERGEHWLETTFGVKHWSAPIGNIGVLNVLHQGLDFGLAKSDQENYENLDEADLHLGGRCIVTKKLDGASCTVVCQPNGEWSVASRSMTFNAKQMEIDGVENVYTRFTKDAVKAGLWWAKKHDEVIAIRGEVCCDSVQRFGVNKDKGLNGFFVYGCEFPGRENWYERHGVYGTDCHFLKITSEMSDGGFKLNTVPVLERNARVTRELLEKYVGKSAEEGEGAVLNISVEGVDRREFTSAVWSYKAKSRDYLSKIK